MNAGSKALDEILCAQKNSFDKAGLGYVGKPSTSKVGSGMNFVKPKGIGSTPPKAKEINVPPKKTTGKINFVKAKPVDTPPQKGPKVKFIPTCHYCGIVGHIRPHCFKLNGISDSYGSFKPTCHHCGVKGHIRPNCHELKKGRNYFGKKLNKKASVSPKKHEKVVKPKIKSIWVRKSELHPCVELEHNTLDDFEESRVVDLAF